jgi:hypothetical protein
MPDEINDLTDSKDQLEDPNNINFFDPTDNEDDSDIESQLIKELEQIGSGGLETPAFVKKKVPSLFKGTSGPQPEISTAKKRNRNSKHSPASIGRGKGEEKAFAYDNWKNEVKKVFSSAKEKKHVN